MKIGTILLLFLIATITVACTKTIPSTQETVTDTTLNDQNLETELVLDPLEDIGTLDEMPIDDSIPE